MFMFFSVCTVFFIYTGPQSCSNHIFLFVSQNLIRPAAQNTSGDLNLFDDFTIYGIWALSHDNF